MECDFVTMDSPFLMKKQKSKRFSTVYKYENLKLKKKIVKKRMVKKQKSTARFKCENTLKYDSQVGSTKQYRQNCVHLWWHLRKALGVQQKLEKVHLRSPLHILSMSSRKDLFQLFQA